MLVKGAPFPPQMKKFVPRCLYPEARDNMDRLRKV
jgi:hypothetical protein